MGLRSISVQAGTSAMCAVWLVSFACLGWHVRAEAQTTTAAAPETSVPAAPAPTQLALVETEARDIDPVVGRFFNQRIAAVAEGLGYEVAPPQAAREAMTELGQGYPPTPAGLWALMHHLGAGRAVFVRIWASGGAYAFQVQVASADGSGPYFDEAVGSEADVLERLAETLAGVLPPPGERLERPEAEEPGAQDAERGMQYFDTAGPPPIPLPRHRPLRICLHGDTAFGFSSDGFRNHMLGARLDYRFDRELALGLYVGYANLSGRDGRVSSLLSYLQFEDRVPMNRRGSVQVPLRLGLGYLARNGPVMRLSAGLGIDLGKRADITLDVLTPTFWLTHETLLFSLDLGVELGFKL